MPNIDELVAQLTLEEKASLMSGADYWYTVAIPRLGIPALMMSDGPHGLRKQVSKVDPVGLHKSVPATCFPTASILASSWDVNLAHDVGAAIAREAAAQDIGMLLGPGLNIIRDPLSGRAFEYFSEDPFVSGKLVAGMIRGIESEGIVATPKHFAVNSQEHLRMTIDEVVDERTLHEIYLEGFRRAILEGKPRALMTGYNRVNGTYANENTHLLQDILIGEWNFDGLIVTDWGGNHDRVAGLKAGNQLEMPGNGGLTNREIVAAVQAGMLDEKVLDERVKSLLDIVFSAQPKRASVSFDEHHQLAVTAAEHSIVLCKNDAILPLQPNQKVALIGDFAKAPRYQGAGSSLVNPTKLPSLLDAFESDDNINVIGFARGFKRRGGASSRLVQEAITLAQQADVVVLCLGLDEAKEAEGLDRADMKLVDNQLELVRKLTKIHKRIVVVYSGGGPVEMPFSADVSAIINAGLAGQGGAEALTNILTGHTNPSGKLAVSWPIRHKDTPTAPYFPGLETNAEHREGLYIGYRAYDTTGAEVLFPFGFGLSYTTFDYHDIIADQHSVSCTVTNMGTIAGEEVAQVYIRPPRTNIFRPTHELKGFAKVFLKPGEQQKITINFDDHAFSYYNPAQKKWSTEAGDYIIEIGASSRDIRLRATLTIQGEASTLYDKILLAPYFTGNVAHISDETFAALLGHAIPAKPVDRSRLTIDDAFSQLKHRRGPTRFPYDVLRFARWLLFKFNLPLMANNLMFTINMPFSKIPSFTNGIVSLRMLKKIFRLHDS